MRISQIKQKSTEQVKPVNIISESRKVRFDEGAIYYLRRAELFAAILYAEGDIPY